MRRKLLLLRLFLPVICLASFNLTKLGQAFRAPVYGLPARLFTQSPSPDSATEEVNWKNGGIKLVGTLYLPSGNGPFPAAVMLHGSGMLTRKDALYREHAERLARAGVAILVYDKRGVGESEGDWRQASLTELADDATGAVNLLRAHKRLRKTRSCFLA